LLYLGN